MTKQTDTSIHVHDDDKRPRDGESEHEPSNRRPRHDHRWLAPPGVRRQPRVGADYQITTLPVAGSEQGQNETLQRNDTEASPNEHTDTPTTIK